MGQRLLEEGGGDPRASSVTIPAGRRRGRPVHQPTRRHSTGMTMHTRLHLLLNVILEPCLVPLVHAYMRHPLSPEPPSRASERVIVAACGRRCERGLLSILGTMTSTLCEDRATLRLRLATGSGGWSLLRGFGCRGMRGGGGPGTDERG